MVGQRGGESEFKTRRSVANIFFEKKGKPGGGAVVESRKLRIYNFRKFDLRSGALFALGPEGSAASGKNWNLAAEKGIFLISP